MDKTQVLRILSLIVGCLAVGISYIVNAFNIFALALKAHFLLSQIQLEILLAVMLLGLCGSLPGGLILDRFGARWAAFMAMIFSVGGSVLIWLSTLSPEFYKDNFGLLVLYFIIAGTGYGFTYMVGTASNIRNFSVKRRGLVVGVLHAFLSIGPAIVMLVYDEFYIHEYEFINQGKQDVGGFFLFIAVTLGVINFFGILVYDYYPPESEEDETLRLIISDVLHNQSQSAPHKQFCANDDPNENTAPSYYNSNPDLHRENSKGGDRVRYDSLKYSATTLSNAHSEGGQSGVHQLSGSGWYNNSTTAKKASEFTLSNGHPELKSLEASSHHTQGRVNSLLTLDFHLLYWSFIILLAIQMMFVQNLTIILVSFNEEEYLTIFPYLTPVLGTIVKPLVGYLSDVTSSWLPRIGFIVTGAVMDLFVWIFSIFLIEYISIVLLATTLADFAAYFVLTLGPVILIDKFGLDTFSRNWGLVITGYAILTGAFLGVFGFVYEEHTLGDSEECYGATCFISTFIICAVVSLLSIILTIIYGGRNKIPQEAQTWPPKRGPEDSLDSLEPSKDPENHLQSYQDSEPGKV